ncbi:hypothetical protein [Achromobacter kerstersii]|uniref:hypothetical protein n=1 Tax=Achromobacter kerstersii TaxID=1353890 RepID=UPI0006C5DAE0|nr:hypothetical protein [Achromobacter kerstersii]CUJ51600.1 Uncharacterised protein [Achromobacter kerstersii]
MRPGFSSRFPRFATAADVGRLLLLLLLVARAWVPVGYMPDADALRQGRLALGFCSAGGGTLAALQALSVQQGHHQVPHQDPQLGLHQDPHQDPQQDPHHGHHDPGAGHGDTSGAGQECPFGLSAHQVLDVPPVVALAPMLLRWLAQKPFLADSPRPPMPAAGPPLGQRAPPSIFE